MTDTSVKLTTLINNLTVKFKKKILKPVKLTTLTITTFKIW